MTEPARTDTADAPPRAAVDINALTASLRLAGADRFDPVRWHYLEVLAMRAAAHQGVVRSMLDAKLAHTLIALEERFEQARNETNEAVLRELQQYPHAADDLQRLFDAVDFQGVRRFAARLKSEEQCASLNMLVRQLGQHSPEHGAPHPEKSATPRTELKTIRKFRATWSKLSADKQLAQALEQAPKNAGPINSHMLALRSLALMREISPDYLSRFVSYADTLLCLEHDEKEKLDKPKKRPTVKAAKK